MVYTRRRRYSRRRVGRSRPFRRNFRRRNLVRRRILRTLRRRPLIPEIKYINYAAETTTVPAASSVLIPAFNPIITQGPGRNQRIGNQINMRSIQTKLVIRDFSGNTGATAPVYPDSLRRIIYFVPTDNYASMQTWYNANVSNLGIETFLPYDVFTVLKDVTFSLGSAYMDLSTEATGVVASGTTRNSRLLSHNFKFPRRAKFSSNEDTLLDPNKDTIFVIVISTLMPSRFSLFSRMTYTDS